VATGPAAGSGSFAESQQETSNHGAGGEYAGGRQKAVMYSWIVTAAIACGVGAAISELGSDRAACDGAHKGRPDRSADLLHGG
jgi:hypothetical protein